MDGRVAGSTGWLVPLLGIATSERGDAAAGIVVNSVMDLERIV